MPPSGTGATQRRKESAQQSCDGVTKKVSLHVLVSYRSCDKSNLILSRLQSSEAKEEVAPLTAPHCDKIA